MPIQQMPPGSPQYRAQTRFPGQQQSPLGGPGGSPQGLAPHHQPPMQVLQPRGSNARGPPPIYNPPSPIRQHSGHSSMQASPSVAMPPQQEPARQTKQVQRIKTEHGGEQSRAPLQPGMMHYPPGSVTASPSPNTVRPIEPMRIEPHGAHMPMAVAPGNRSQVIDLTEQAARGPQYYDPRRPQSPAVREYNNSRTGYSNEGYRPPQEAPPQASTPAPSSAPKRSVMSMASILNSEPDDKPKKPEYHQPSQSSSSSRSGMDILQQQQQQQHRGSAGFHHGPNIPSPASDIPSAVSSSGQRDWPARPYGQQAQYSDSPRMQPQQGVVALPESSRPGPIPADYRAAAFGRHVPSPPPNQPYGHHPGGPHHPHGGHSRTGSYGHVQSQTNTPTDPYPRGGGFTTSSVMSPALAAAQPRQPAYGGPPPPPPQSAPPPHHRSSLEGYPPPPGPGYSGGEPPVSLRAYRNSTSRDYDDGRGPPPPGPGGYDPRDPRADPRMADARDPRMDPRDPRMADPYARSPMAGERYPPPPVPPPGPPGRDMRGPPGPPGPPGGSMMYAERDRERHREEYRLREQQDREREERVRLYEEQQRYGHR
jgi:hypothetical protein